MTTTTICEDGRPEYQYGALIVAAGREAFGWLPARTVTPEEVADLLDEVNAEIDGEIDWDEFGALVLVSGPVIPGPGASAAVALAPLLEAKQAVAAAKIRQAQLYAAALDAGWTFRDVETVTGDSRGWIHTLAKRGRSAAEPDE